MTERSRRDALERLQVEAKGLEAELAVEHAPAFLEQRSELTQALPAERQRAGDLERTLSTARAEEAEARGRVTELQARLAGMEQRRLDLWPLLLVGLVVAVILGGRPWLWPREPLGLGLGAFLGLLFGPRLVERLLGKGVAPAVSEKPAPTVGRFAASLALLALAAPAALLSTSELLDPSRATELGSGSRAFGQLFAILGALVGLRGAATEPPGARRLAKRLLGGAGLGMVAVLTLRSLAPLLGGVELADPALLATALVPLVPLAAAVRSRWAALRSNLLRLVASPATAALAAALVLAFRRALDGDRVVTVLGVSAQLTALAFSLASDLDATASPKLRWALRLLALAPLGLFFL